MTSLQQAIEARDEAKARMNAAKQFSKKWSEAEEDYEFWSNKAAMLDVMQKNGMVK